jgi:hypothetical protein
MAKPSVGNCPEKTFFQLKLPVFWLSKLPLIIISSSGLSIKRGIFAKPLSAASIFLAVFSITYNRIKGS